MPPDRLVRLLPAVGDSGLDGGRGLQPVFQGDTGDETLGYGSRYPTRFGLLLLFLLRDQLSSLPEEVQTLHRLHNRQHGSRLACLQVKIKAADQHGILSNLRLLALIYEWQAGHCAHIDLLVDEKPLVLLGLREGKHLVEVEAQRVDPQYL